jgi:alpha-L-fucosidase 2
MAFTRQSIQQTMGTTTPSTVYCSYPDQVCVYGLSSSSPFPNITVSLENQLNSAPYSTSCDPQGQFVVLAGVTQEGPPRGMQYEGKAQLMSGIRTTYCSGSSLIIPSDSTTQRFSLVIGTATNYCQLAGNAAGNFSFAMPGSDLSHTTPFLGPIVTSVISAAITKAERDIRQAHIADYQGLADQFALELPDIAGSFGLETSVIIDRYNASGPGDPYLESTLFALGRHLSISSARDNSLPPTLAGRWSETIEAAWGADYHANINFQMNHWGVDQTGLRDL